MYEYMFFPSFMSKLKSILELVCWTCSLARLISPGNCILILGKDKTIYVFNYNSRSWWFIQCAILVLLLTVSTLDSYLTEIICFIQFIGNKAIRLYELVLWKYKWCNVCHRHGSKYNIVIIMVFCMRLGSVYCAPWEKYKCIYIIFGGLQSLSIAGNESAITVLTYSHPWWNACPSVFHKFQNSGKIIQT